MAWTPRDERLANKAALLLSGHWALGGPPVETRDPTPQHRDPVLPGDLQLVRRALRLAGLLEQEAVAIREGPGESQA